MPLKKIMNSTILYIEDDDITRKQFSQFLESQCKTLYLAEDGQKGFELYKEFEPDIVITDIEMPKLNGLELAKKIRKLSVSTQIIIITAYQKTEYLLDAVNLQLTQYLIKPISLEKITQVLELASGFLGDQLLGTKKHFSKDIYYDNYTKELVNNNEIINLSKHERALLEMLIVKYPAPLSYESINVHIYDYEGSKNAIKLLVGSLRHKIESKSIINVSGFGYKLKLMDDR